MTCEHAYVRDAGLTNPKFTLHNGVPERSNVLHGVSICLSQLYTYWLNESEMNLESVDSISRDGPDCP